MDLPSNIQDLISSDLQTVNSTILDHLHTDVALINQIGQYIIQAGGKRLRPITVLLAARACGYNGTQHIHLAAIIELIHTATLLHDDVVDASDQRRHRKTANAIWGNAASVLVGDFLYTRAFQMMTQLQTMRIMETFAHATNRIAEGEVLQLLNCNDPNTTTERYLEIIERKTATLFQAGTRISAIISQTNPQQEQAMAQYGLHLGIAFQLIDDILDYSPNNPELGKNIGDDLADGKITLPLIQALADTDQHHKDIIRKAITTGDRNQLNIILETIAKTGAINYTMNLAQQHAQHAKAALQEIAPTQYRTALFQLTEFAINRKH
ncbi:octaprenyl diphosphate synthase [Achromatium sp. WMS2]|nr:octaprenyl diphosphate synthase [Achromatium sp. WMS2]